MAFRTGFKLICGCPEAIKVPKSYHIRCCEQSLKNDVCHLIESNLKMVNSNESEIFCKIKGNNTTTLNDGKKILRGHFRNNILQPFLDYSFRALGVVSPLKYMLPRTISTITLPNDIISEEGVFDTPYSQTETDIESANVSSSFYSKLKLQPLLSQRNLNDIAFNKRQIIERNEQVRNHKKIIMPSSRYNNDMASSKLGTTARGFKHQFDLNSTEDVISKNYFSSTDLLDINQIKRKCNELLKIEKQTIGYSIPKIKRVSPKLYTRPKRILPHETLSAQRWESGFENKPLKVKSKCSSGEHNFWNRNSSHSSNFSSVSRGPSYANSISGGNANVKSFHGLSAVFSESQTTKRLNCLLTNNTVGNKRFRKIAHPRSPEVLYDKNRSKFRVSKNLTSIEMPEKLWQQKNRFDDAPSIYSQRNISKSKFTPIWFDDKEITKSESMKTWCFKPKNHRKGMQIFSKLMQLYGPEGEYDNPNNSQTLNYFASKCNAY